MHTTPLTRFPEASACFHAPALNAFMAQEPKTWSYVRRTLQQLLAQDGGNAALRDDEALRARALVPMGKVRMHLPARIGDYTDFYSSREHATNVGIMFRCVQWGSSRSVVRSSPSSIDPSTAHRPRVILTGGRTTPCSPTGSTSPSATTAGPPAW